MGQYGIFQEVISIVTCMNKIKKILTFLTSVPCWARKSNWWDSASNLLLLLCFFQGNLAYGKPTDQDYSMYNQGRSSRAVDGNSNTHFMAGNATGSCTMTQRDKNVAPWWRVDLQQVHHVSEVYIVNRGSECGCPSRFQNFEITVGRWTDLLIHSISSNLSLLQSSSCTVFSWMNVPVLVSNLAYCSTVHL